MRSDTWKKTFAMLALPYFRLELPGWHRLAGPAGLPLGNHALWANEPPRTIRSKTHGLWMTLDMRDWCERLTYFIGRYYELPIEMAVRALVREGDTFIDVGANTGMVTLLGSVCVGPTGSVYAFEPNPLMAQRILDVIALNRLTNVTVVPSGLSVTTGGLALTVVEEANGWSTFGTVRVRNSELTYKTVVARVGRGDDLIPETLRGPMTLKIDVEGFECHALKGMARLIDQRHPAIIVELEPELLESSSSSVDELFGILASHGYLGYAPLVIRRRMKHSLVLERVRSSSDATAGNLVWLHPNGPHQRRATPHLRNAMAKERRL